MAKGKSNQDSNLSRPGSGSAVSQDPKGPMPQHRRLAMGEKVDGQKNPNGEDAPSSKPTIKGGW